MIHEQPGTGCFLLCGKKMKQRKLVLATALLGAAVLTACGGGGGGGASPPVDTAALTIEGTAIKGPMSKAKISVYKTNADGTKGELLNGTTSRDDGTYRVTVKGYSGIVLVEAEATPDTRMDDEATGELITPATGFKMRASFSATSGVPNIAQINPFTELATATALAKSGGLNQVNVGQSNKDMREWLRFDPLTTTAEFGSNKVPKNLAALALATVSKMAQSGDLGCSSGADQAARVACVIREMSQRGTGDPGLKAAIELRGSEISDGVAEFELPRLILSVPSRTPVTSATPRELTQAFMGALRGNAKALQADDLTLQTELDAVAEDLKGHTAAITSSNLDTLNVARMGVQFWTDVIKSDRASFISRKDFYKGDEYLGECNFYSDGNYSVVATSKVDAKFVDCGTAPQYVPATDQNGESCKAVGDLCATVWTVRVRLHPDAANPGTFTVYTQTRKAQSKFTSRSYLYSELGTNKSGPICPTGASCIPIVVQYEDLSSRAHYGADFPGNVATLMAMPPDIDGTLTTVNLAGELSPAFQVAKNSYFKGYSLHSVLKSSEEEQVVGYTQNVNLTATLSKTDTLDKLAISGLMDLIKNNVLDTRIKLTEGSYLQSGSGDSSEDRLFKFEAGRVGGTIKGDLKISAFKFDASRNNYIPTLISFSGSVQRNGVRFFEGTLMGETLNHDRFDMLLPRSSSNFQTRRVSFEGEVAIPNRPVLKVSLSGARKDTGSSASDTTKLSGQYAQGSITMNVSGSGSALLNWVTLESTDGITLFIDESKTSYPLTRGSESMGIYSATDKKLTYADNSSEQF